MFYIYANGKSIYQPMDSSLSLFAPKLTLEMGKAGSLTFQIPPSNKYYNALSQLSTTITVEMDDTEIFRGRVLTNNRNFNNVRTIYCEGDLAYLVDSVQKAEKYEGEAHTLFRKIIAAHNARVEAAKRFTVGDITVENRDVLLTGKSDDITDAETGEFDYKQIALNSVADEWQNTFDFIETCLIDFTGGYLRTRRQNGITYIDLVTDYGTTAVQEIEFGRNLLDLAEEVSAEDVFTVLIPLGDENLTIESVNNGSDELVDSDAVARYGRIIKTHVFDSVNDPSTLLENGRRYLASNVNIPVTLTVKAVDMHLVDPNASPIYIGDKVHVMSVPHGMSDELTCTKIEYDMENPANNTYTFGTPKQSLTERYRKDKAKASSESSRGAGGGGSASEAASEEAKKDLDEFFDAWINVDPELAHIDLGTLYKKLQDGKSILESSCGISLDAPSGNINIKTLRKEFDDLGEAVDEQSAYIDLLNNELGARIALVASKHQELADRETSHYAELSLSATDQESKIAANTEVIKKLDGQMTESRTNITQLSTDLQAQIKLEAEHKKALDNQITTTKASITQLSTDLQAQIKLEAEHKKTLDNQITTTKASITQLSSDLQAQIKLEAEHKKTLDDQITTTKASITQLSTDLQAQIKLEAEHKKALDNQITTTKASITQLSNDLSAQITLEATHNDSQNKTIASISAKADKNESSITLKANKTYVDSKIVTVTGRIEAAEASIKTLQADIADVETLIANRIKGYFTDTVILKAGSITAASSITAGSFIRAPQIIATSTMSIAGAAVATQPWVTTKLADYATQSWVEGKGYLTKIPDSLSVGVGFYAPYIRATTAMSVGGAAVATQAWVTEQLKSYAKSDHSHAWSTITGKPSSFTPTKHRHSISLSIANGHTHQYQRTSGGTKYTTTGVSTNATHTVSTNTGYYPS